MDGYISQALGYWFLAGFGAIMILITYLFARWKRWNTHEGFLLANRKLGWKLGGVSIAASWIWAPALFLSSQFAYEMGLPGIFWFTFPNILALAVFYFLGPRIRQLLPEGYTLPQYIQYRLKSSRVHKAYLVPYFFYQIMAVTVQLFAGGNLISLLTGIPLMQIMPILLIIALGYTLISGLEASVVTDFIQMLTIFVIGAIILPLAWQSAGSGAIAAGFGGLNGTSNIFDPGVAFSFGLITAISLIAGSISDQQYWQRTFALKRKEIGKAFIFGSLVFGIVPIALSTLGFMAAGDAVSVTLPEGIDASMIGVQTVSVLLPAWATMLFVIMLLAGLSSTLDSAFSATASLWSTDVAKYSSKENKILEKEQGHEALSKNEKEMESKLDKHVLRQARFAMIGMGLLGWLIAMAVYYIPSLGLSQLFWIEATTSVVVVIPTVLSLYWSKISEKGVFWGVVFAFIIGLPLFIYSNILGESKWILATYALALGISIFFSLFFREKNKDNEPLKIVS